MNNATILLALSSLCIFRGRVLLCLYRYCAAIAERIFVVCGGGLVENDGGVGGRWDGADIVAIDDLDICSHVHSHINFQHHATPQMPPLYLLECA
jgi:hypothetical protein